MAGLLAEELLPGCGGRTVRARGRAGSPENALHTDVGLIYFWGALLIGEDLHPLYRGSGDEIVAVVG